MNVQGLLNNFAELKYVMRKKKVDICMLNETHLTDDISDGEVRVSGYNVIRCNSDSTRTGGVLIYVNKSIKFDSVRTSRTQFAWIANFRMRLNEVETVIAAVYLSASENKTRVLNFFENWCEEVCEHSSVVIVGDFNVDVSLNTAHSARIESICAINGLIQCVREPTRVTPTSTTTIDLCLSNVRGICCEVTDEDQVADHKLLLIKLKQGAESRKPKLRYFKSWSEYSRENMREKIDGWPQLNQIDAYSVEERTEWLLTNIRDSAGALIQKKVARPDHDFFDAELEQLCAMKNSLYKRAQYAGNLSSAEQEELWANFRSFRREYKKSICEKKFAHNQRRLNKVSGDMKGTWRVMNSILHREHEDIEHVESVGARYDDDAVIASNFNDYFVRSIIDLNADIKKVPFECNVRIEPNVKFNFRGVSIANIKAILRDLKNGTDEFNANKNVLTDVIDRIGVSVANLINDSLMSGVFPSILKQSTVIPIRKVAGTVKINEFRPINMLPCFEKLLEKVVFEQLNEFIEKHNIISNNQSGFRRNFSCETAINTVLLDWTRALDKSECVLAVFLDFQRAFETIEPELLIKKLELYGIEGAALEWFRSYLTDRRQVVKVGEQISEALNVNFGVPQGSTLGPLLFNMYINDLGDTLLWCLMRLFADDTLIYIILRDIEEAQRKLNEDLQRIYRKICQNKLRLNLNKTKAMLITRQRNVELHDIDLHIDGTKLELVRSIKYLGVHIDDELKFGENVKRICSIVGMKTGVLSRLRGELNRDQKLMLYKSVIQPHFTYCASVLFMANKCDIFRLQKMQNKCMRAILRVNRRTHVDDMLGTLNLMNVYQMIIYNTLIFIFKMKNDMCPTELNERVRPNSSARTGMVLRNDNDLMTSGARKACAQKSVFYSGILCFNAMPNELKEETNFERFKLNVKKYVMLNYK